MARLKRVLANVELQLGQVQDYLILPVVSAKYPALNSLVEKSQDDRRDKKIDSLMGDVSKLIPQLRKCTNIPETVRDELVIKMNLSYSRLKNYSLTFFTLKHRTELSTAFRKLRTSLNGLRTIVSPALVKKIDEAYESILVLQNKMLSKGNYHDLADKNDIKFALQEFRSLSKRLQVINVALIKSENKATEGLRRWMIQGWKEVLSPVSKALMFLAEEVHVPMQLRKKEGMPVFN